jgi:hypothetical protein
VKHIRDAIPEVLASLGPHIRPSVYQRNEAEMRRERDMIATPSKWPRFPLLCVKRKSPAEAIPGLGLMVAKDATAPTLFVIECNINEALGLLDMTDDEIRHSFPSHCYDSIDHVLADGWVVD